MDLLFHRYASPFLLLDQIIRAGDLSEVVSPLWEIEEEEKEWQYFLAKVFDKSFSDFKESMKPQQGMSKQEIETTISESMSMINSFIPEN